MSGLSTQNLAAPLKASSADGVRLSRTHSAANSVMSDFTPTPVRLQTKLTVNTPGDKYEHEADRVADMVMRMPEPTVSKSSAGECPECMKSRSVDPALGKTLMRDVADDDSEGDFEDFEVMEDDASDGDEEVIGLSEGGGGLDDVMEVLGDVLGAAGALLVGEAQAAGQNQTGKKSPWITQIDVDLSGQNLTLNWSDGRKPTTHVISSGRGRPCTKGDPCAQQTEKNCTPPGTYTATGLGNASTKNSKGDEMAWFVGIGTRGIGIHNSQIADGTPRSHGCMRVGKGATAEAFAKLINKGVKEGKTKIVISGKAPTKAWKPPKGCPKAKKTTVQPKLTVNTPGDKYEQEADRVAEQVMRMPEPQVQRQCACGKRSTEGECSECKKKKQEATGSLQRVASSPVGGIAAPPIVNSVLSSRGSPLPTATRSFMESRFGQDFSQVRIHTDAQAQTSAEAVFAKAYTVGQHVAFGKGQFQPGSSAGHRLLAHELTHVVQQNGAKAGGVKRSQPDLAPSIGHSDIQTIARFSDDQHFVTEKAALADSGFSEDQQETIHEANVERDYSQVGTVGNALLLCRPQKFGGYRPEEHFDNFIWDVDQWRSRSSDPGKQTSPLSYINTQLESFGSVGATETGLKHIGNAFHTIEDFFAHSNFIELTKGDLNHGGDLVTGSVEDESGNQTHSLAHVVEGVSDPSTAPFYKQVGEAAAERTSPRSHARMAKDQPGAKNFEEARRLAALVIQSLAKQLSAIGKTEERGSRIEKLSVVMAQIESYLRPPDPKNPWWDHLQEQDSGAIDVKLAHAERTTPKTANHCLLSPLRNLEASRDMPFAIPLGVAMPAIVGENVVWFQAGIGVTRPMKFDPLDEDRRKTEVSRPVIGAQIGVSF